MHECQSHFPEYEAILGIVAEDLASPLGHEWVGYAHESRISLAPPKEQGCVVIPDLRHVREGSDVLGFPLRPLGDSNEFEVEIVFDVIAIESEPPGRSTPPRSAPEWLIRTDSDIYGPTHKTTLMHSAKVNRVFLLPIVEIIRSDSGRNLE